MWVEKEEAETAEASEDNIGEGPDLINPRVVVEASDLEKQRLSKVEIVAISGVPENPTDAELESLRVARHRFNSLIPTLYRKEKRICAYCWFCSARNGRKETVADNCEDNLVFLLVQSVPLGSRHENTYL